MSTEASAFLGSGSGLRNQYLGFTAQDFRVEGLRVQCLEFRFQGFAYRFKV